MIKKVRNYIKENKLLEYGDKVLVALSGGPDSVCLLHILYKLKDEFGIELGAIHINHMLRAEESEQDEKYTYNLCNTLGIDYYVERINIDYIAKEKGVSIEVAGRESRYEAFDNIKRIHKYTKIAVAHNANDQAETILMRMMRGTGLEGLTGIKAKREDGVIRPILCLNRDEIEKYCEINDIKPRIDKSNYERIYSRNKVRLDILPYMKEYFNTDIIETLNRMANLLQKDNECIEEYAKKCYYKYCSFEKDYIKISNDLFKSENESIVTRVVKIAFKDVSKSHQNFEMKHIYEIIFLVDKETGKQVHLTNNVVAENLYGDICLKIKRNNIISNNEILIDKERLEESFDFDGYCVKFEILDGKNKIQFSNNDLIKFFDYDKIEKRILIRYRKDGDKIIPLGMKGKKKIKDIFMDMKVPREERNIIPIVLFDENISWLVGMKVSEVYKITKDTKKVLKITFYRKE